MLELVTIFLATLLISAISVRLYRFMSGWKGFNQTVVGRRNSSVRMTLRAQQGYISWMPLSPAETKKIRLRRSKCNIKAPWGW